MNRSQGLIALFWIGVLFLECEFLAVPNYELRTEIRQLLHLPIYHLTFSFLVFAAFLYRLQAARLPALDLDRLGWRWAGLHLGWFCLLAIGIHPLANSLRAFPPSVRVATWLLVLAAFLGSWAAGLLRPRRWPEWLFHHASWLVPSLALAFLSLGIVHVSNWLWHPLAGGTLRLAYWVLNCVYDEVSVGYSNFSLGTPSFSILIEPGCSGYEGIGLIVLFTMLYLWLRRDELNFPAALLLLPLGCALSWWINGLRIATLVVIGTSFSPYVAMKGFHSQAGWLTFITTSIVLVLAVERAGWFRSLPALAEHEEEEVVHDYPALPFTLPLLAIFLGTIVGSALSGDFPVLYPVRILLALLALWFCRSVYGGILGTLVSARAVATGLVVYVLWIAMVECGPGATVWEALSGPWAYLWLAFRALGSSLVIPLAEELAFRGFLMRRLQSHDFEAVAGTQVGWKALLASSLAFGLLHGDWLAATLAGLAYGQLYRRGASLGEVACAHAVTNAAISLQVILLGHWSLW